MLVDALSPSPVGIAETPPVTESAPSAARSTPTQPPARSGAAIPRVPAPPAAGAVTTARPPARVETGTVALERAIYGDEDRDVRPPVIIVKQFPRREGIAGEASGELELIVDATGHVEQARLLPGAGRIPEKMLVSAAKTWQFVPAQRNGQPVRYRLILPITW
jgi:hypothetical protein